MNKKGIIAIALVLAAVAVSMLIPKSKTVVDNDTLKFIEKGSTIPKDMQGKPVIYDGVIFKYEEK